jgi:hypothetical protein
MRARAWIVVAALGCATLAGCGGGSHSSQSAGASPDPAAARSCPKAWTAGWQALANAVEAPVYCPTWMPQPLDGRIGGSTADARIVDPHDRSYLVSFVYFDHDAGAVNHEVHVNFRGYPGRTAIPKCADTQTVNGKTVHPKLPCFSDAQTAKPVGSIKPTLYTANQGIDQWHLLYAWRRFGSLYTLSEHVAPPYSYRQVLGNLNRMARGLVVVEPAS